MSSKFLNAKRGILVRVGIDSIYGRWNSPVNAATGDFVYIPIPENEKFEFKSDLTISFDSFSPSLNDFSRVNRLSGAAKILLPDHLKGKNVHLDPDFSHLTYGDNGKRRGKNIKDEFRKGDFIVFYAGLKPIEKHSCPLYYAIIGFFLIDKVAEAKDIRTDEAYINAHTRKKYPEPTDVIVFGNPAFSGRLNKCILIGEFRDRAYRIKKDLLLEWDGITANDGFIQRSAVPPRFNNPTKFLSWFYKQNISLVKNNN